MKTRILGSIGAAIVLLAAVVTIAAAAPQISIYTDKASYQAGDTIEMSLAAENAGEALSVDVYIGLVTPEGSLYTLGQLAWSQAIGPWIEDIHVPSGFSMDRSPFFWFPLPCEMPPIHRPGEFWFLAGLSQPGSLHFVSGISSAAFEIHEVSGLHYYVNGVRGANWTWYDGSQELPWETITHALDSVEGSPATPVTIHVAGGIYSPNTGGETADGETFPLNMKSWVSIVGEGPEHSTMLDAEGWAYHVICCEDISGVVIEGFTITGGLARGEFGQSDSWGGGIYCWNSSITIRNNRITSNSAHFGGGICSYYSSGVIADNVLVNNLAMYGGAIDCSESSMTISGNTISGNRVTGGVTGAGGGGIYCWGGSPIIVDNTISDNLAYYAHWDSGGGGIMCWRSDAKILDNMIVGNSVEDSGEGGGGIFSWAGFCEIIGNTIAGNCVERSLWSQGSGGGIYCYGTLSTIIDNVIYDNESPSSGGGIVCLGDMVVRNNRIEANRSGYGGGISSDYGSSTISGNTIVDNIADGGGGIGCGGAEWIVDSSPDISNNLIARNRADGDGGGVHAYSYYDGTPHLSNNTIVGNSAGDDGGGIYGHNVSPPIIDCIIWDNGDDLYDCSATYCCIEDTDDGEGNIHAAPMFVLGPLGDYYLDPNSACIDAGSRSAEDAGLSGMTTQTDGTPDVGSVDMGFHYPLQCRSLRQTK